MAPGPDPKGLPRPKMSLELALAMLRLAPWLVLSGFKTDGRPPQAQNVSKLTDGPRSRSQRLSQAQNVFGAGFSHAAAGALAGFIGFQNWRGPNCRWSWLLPCCGWRPGWFYRLSKLTDGPRSRSQRPPQAQNVFGAGFSHAAAGALAGFIRFQNWRMAPGPDPRGFPRPKMYIWSCL